MFNTAQLNRIEQQIINLREELKLKEQLDRIETMLLEISNNFGGVSYSDLTIVMNRISRVTEELKSKRT